MLCDTNRQTARQRHDAGCIHLTNFKSFVFFKVPKMQSRSYKLQSTAAILLAAQNSLKIDTMTRFKEYYVIVILKG